MYNLRYTLSEVTINAINSSYYMATSTLQGNAKIVSNMNYFAYISTTYKLFLFICTQRD